MRYWRRRLVEIIPQVLFFYTQGPVLAVSLSTVFFVEIGLSLWLSVYLCSSGAAPFTALATPLVHNRDVSPCRPLSNTNDTVHRCHPDSSPVGPACPRALSGVCIARSLPTYHLSSYHTTCADYDPHALDACLPCCPHHHHQRPAQRSALATVPTIHTFAGFESLACPSVSPSFLGRSPGRVHLA